jgi:hypothetical protein
MRVNLLQWSMMPARLSFHATGWPEWIGAEDDPQGAGKTVVYDREDFRRAMRPKPKPAAGRFLAQLIADRVLTLDRVIWVGGEPDEGPSILGQLRVALGEQLKQAANVLAVRPFHAIAYAGTPLTSAAVTRRVRAFEEDGH